MRVFLVLLVMLVAIGAQAQTQPQFFSSIPDLPLMEGLRELPELTTSFDKPEGRILESTALIESGAPDEVRAFYARTLPQLGWVASGKSRFTRERETLNLLFETGGGQNFLKIMVAPQD